MRRRVFIMSILAVLPVFAADESKARIKGVREYAKQGPTMIAKIAPYLDDANENVRFEAVKAIAELGTQRALNPLIAATMDASAQVQVRATDGLVNFYLPGYLKTGVTAGLRTGTTALKGRFTDTNTDLIDPYVTVRSDVVSAVGKLVRGGINMEVRANAARAVGILRGVAALPDLYEALRTKDNAVLYESLIAIQKIRQLDSGPKIQYLLNDLHDKVQIAAIETTGILRNREALGDLRAVLERARNLKIQRAALTAIAMMASEQERGVFEQYFENKDEGLRGAAAEGLGRLKNLLDVPRIERAFEGETKMGARLSLAFAMVMMGRTELSDFSPLQYLVNTLNSRSYQDAAEPLLVECTRDGEVRKAVYPALTRAGATKVEKLRLLRVLGQTGDNATVGVIEALKEDTDGEIAVEASRALRSIASR